MLCACDTGYDFKNTVTSIDSKITLGDCVFNKFSWRSLDKIIFYDSDTESIIIRECDLIDLIKLVNPLQRDRKIKIVDEL